ncbi:cytochrome b/b6 domain-containing protein [bacterium]|nr:cytochrome b/b6 domain-containing protein [bacterium]
MNEKIYLTPTPVRIWHWLNAFGIITLVLTGAEIRFPEYAQVLGNYKAAVRLHDTAGIVVTLSFGLWFIYYAFVARNLLRLYIPSREDIQRGMIRQAVFYGYQYFRGGPNPHHQTPENKFNALQKTAYAAIMFVCIPLVIVTGVLMMNVSSLREMVMAVGGLRLLIGAHWLVACVFCAFLFTHIYLATLGHTPFAHFKPMWTGWEEAEDPSDRNT